MKIFELSRCVKKDRRKFKIILYEIQPDSCIDETNEVGTLYNANGITWIREYCEKALPSIKGMSLRCEFLDDERTELCGHGETGIEDNMPVFENATVIGTFTHGYISDVETDEGIKTYCIGEGEIDALCYNNFVNKLEKDINDGNAPFGSVEILKTDDNEGIIYKYGYKEYGRIPMIFKHSGYALLGVTPADKSSKILELNNKEETNNMNESQIRDLVSAVVEETIAASTKISECQAECQTKVDEANELVATATTEKEQVIADSTKIQEALEACQNELAETYKKMDALYEELDELREELGKAKAKERINELNAALADFTDGEKEYAKDEIDAFNADPVSCEINSIVSKIWEGIGRRSKSVVVETNSSNVGIEDIFSEVVTNEKVEDCNIF